MSEGTRLSQYLLVYSVYVSNLPLLRGNIELLIRLWQVIKNSKDFFDQSLDEIKLLKLLQQHDPDDVKNVLRLYDFFYFKVCSNRPCFLGLFAVFQAAPLLTV